MITTTEKIGLHSVHVWLAIRIKLNYLKKTRHEHFEVKISPYYKWLVIEFQITLNLAYMLVILDLDLDLLPIMPVWHIGQLVILEKSNIEL